MSKILLILLWPVGIAVIICAGALMARRAPTAAAGAHSVPSFMRPPVISGHGSSSEPVARDLLRFFLSVFAGLVAVFAVMARAHAGEVQP